MTLPNFLILGANKAGTSALARCLGDHPQVFVSPVKEPMFFAFEGESLERNTPAAHLFLLVCVNNLKDYEQLFSGVENELAIGEASTGYLCDHRAAVRIKHHVPDVKLIAILRHPADRAFSRTQH